MKISVLMPMKNAAPYVAQAVSSVLLEKNIPLELIVVDDGSIDGSATIVSSMDDPRIQLVTGPKKGIAACLNRGFENVTGDLVMRCDADDVYPAGRIEKQVMHLSKNPEAIAVCGGFEMIDTAGLVVAEPFSRGTTECALIDISRELMQGELRTSLCTFAIRTSFVARLNGFREYFETAEDIDFALRLGALGPVGFISESFYQYRIHGQSITHTSISNRRNFFDAKAKIFALQRLQRGTDDLMQGIAEKPPLPLGVDQNTATNHILDLMIGDAWRLHSIGSNGPAIKKALEVLRRYPFIPRSWDLLFRLSIKRLAQLVQKAIKA